MFTYELARRLEASRVTATALHPGMTNTAFSAEDPARAMAPVVFVARPFMRTAKKGAETVVYLASSSAVEGVTGRYYANRKEKKSNQSSSDDREVTGRRRRSAPSRRRCRRRLSPEETEDGNSNHEQTMKTQGDWWSTAVRCGFGRCWFSAVSQ